MHQYVTLPEVEAQPKLLRSTSIAQHLKSMIVSGHLKPGDRLPTEEKLCTHFGVSRTTLRESVQILRASGVLEVTPGRGSFVRVPNIDLMMSDLAFAGKFANICKKEVYDILRLLSLDVTEKACLANTDKKKELHKFVIERAASAAENEVLERKWLCLIATIAGQEMKARLMASFMEMKKDLRQNIFADENNILRTMQMQLRINTSIEEGDAESAERLMKSYMNAPELLN